MQIIYKNALYNTLYFKNKGYLFIFIYRAYDLQLADAMNDL